MNWESLTRTEQVDELLERSERQPVLFFKHSTRCPISHGAYGELERFQSSDEAKRLKIALILVIEHRDVSNRLAEATRIKHESPQAILIENQKVLWHASHGELTESAFKQAAALPNGSVD